MDCWKVIGALGPWFAGFATFCIVVYTIWRDQWKRPKLLLSFDNERDVKSQVNTVGRINIPSSTLSRWLRVRVRNANRRRIAKNCRAFLIGIEEVESGEDKFPNDVRQLRWMHDHSDPPSERELLPGVNHWVDVAAAIDGQNALSVCTFPPWVLESPGDYVFSVQVSAEDADPAVVRVQVHWDGTWQSLQGKDTKGNMAQLESKNDKADSASDASQCRYKLDKWPSRVTACATVVIAIITFFYMVYARQQSIYVGEQVTQTGESIKILHRPWCALSGGIENIVPLSLQPGGVTFTVRYSLKNGGTAPALKLFPRVSSKVGRMEELLREAKNTDPCDWAKSRVSSDEHGRMVLPGDTITYPLWEHQSRREPPISSDAKVAVLAELSVSYFDEFGAPHCTGERFYYVTDQNEQEFLPAEKIPGGWKYFVPGESTF
jgi:hypothetical protein